MDWYDKAVEQLEDELEQGTLSQSEFNAEMRELGREFEDAAREAAKNSYDNYRGGW